MKKGILIIAVGHENYTKMAINLAASIRVNDPKLRIALATDAAPPVWLQERGLIDEIVPVPAEYIGHNGKEAFIKSKLHMYELSPFEETIFLDADQIMIAGKSLVPVFKELAKVDLTFSNTGIAGSSIWADMKDIKKVYGDKPFWNFHSEFVYFKKSQKVADYFRAAQKVFTDNKITSAVTFGGAVMADELAFQCAAMITGKYPHKQNWLPNFWFDRDQKNSRKYPYQLTDYITYSIGGNLVPPAVKDNYNTLANHYFAKLNLSNPYRVIDKRTFIPGRKTV